GAPACGIGGLGRDAAWAGRVGLRQWPRVPAVGGDRGPAAQHTLAARAEGLSLPDSWHRIPAPAWIGTRALQCSQGSRACVRLETPRTYGTSGLDNRPLFGETSAKDRIINLVVGSLTSLLILVTLISAFVFPQLPPKPLNIFFAVCISLSSITACILIYWYRQGDLEPKFRNLIYYILFSIIMLCICANLYFHDVGK
uniref:Transmembrane protein 243 n=1 Tax=Bos taurus TaxID=9913 RepID=A0AAF6ZJT0_BOVIN